MESADSFRIGIVGLGLIGGSVALAARQSGWASQVCAWDQSAEVLARGQALGVIDRAVADIPALMAQVDVAVLATPTRAGELLLPQMLAHSGGVRCVTDVASVKGTLRDVAATVPLEQGALFVPGHPIAGSERHGVEAARGDLFEAHRVILTPGERTDDGALALAHALWEAAGAEVVHMSVEEHDGILAATSHLPHVLAYALVDTLSHAPERESIFRFAAGGFRDFTRIASSDPVMWRDIALANRDALLEAIDSFGLHLATLRSAVASGDGASLEQTFCDAKAARDQFVQDLEARTGKPSPA